MIIIVEGPDGLGKSTLCAALGDRLNCPVYTPYEKEGLKLSREFIRGHDQGSLGMALLLADRADIVLDRSFVSEIAYSTGMNREIDEDYYFDLDAKVSRVPHLVVLLLQPVRGYDLAKERGVSDISREDWNAAAYGYEDWTKWTACRFLPLAGDMELNMKVESVFLSIVRDRNAHSSKDYVFIEMARNAARRSTCLSRRTGAVLVSGTGHVIAVGYNGVPTGMKHPVECQRLREGIASGDGLDKCGDSHAEENCLVHAALNGADPGGGTLYTIQSPCHRCARMLVNAKISEVCYEDVYDKGAVEFLRECGVNVRGCG